MIQCFARFHPTPSRFKVWRMASTDNARGVHPLSLQTSATKARVHRLVGLPNSRGRRCNRSFRFSSWARSHTRPGSLRAWDLAAKHPDPAASNARMAFRTAWAVHPTIRPMSAGAIRSALASSTWDRRTVNASADFRPASRACRSSGKRGRTNVRALFIPAGYDPAQIRKPSESIPH